MIIRLLFAAAVAGAALPGPAHAGYDENIVGPLEGFYVYANVDYVFLRLKNQPTTHDGCKPDYFVINSSVPVDRRKAMLARLSLAYALQEPINIGYAAHGDCSDGGYIQVYRVG